MNISSATSIASQLFSKASRADTAFGTRNQRKVDNANTKTPAFGLIGRPQKTANDASDARAIATDTARHNPIHVRGYSAVSTASLMSVLSGKADDSPLDLAA